jgi:hypothetical protein
VPLASDNACARELAWYFYGGDGAHGLGLPYQLRTLARTGLKATFFIDPLFSYALGQKPLGELISLVQEHRQEIGLHLHPEWLTDPRCAGLPRFSGPLLHQYVEADQAALIRAGLDRLRTLGARQVPTFRAGSWGASLTTLCALAANGVAYDSSLNGCFAASFPGMSGRLSDVQPVRLEGVWEFPVTNFIDRPPAGRRPLHVCAASLGEFRTALEHAAANQWFAVVIVLHSFEFVRVQRLASGKLPTPQRLVAARFEKLCAYLAANADRFETCHFADLNASAIPDTSQAEVAVSWLGRTAGRQVQQLVSRLY